MCGIAGGYSLSIHTMLEAISHRGRDGAGVFASRTLVLGHLLHATHSRASQPLYGCSLVCAGNGEIYNHAELRETLETHTLRTKSDFEPVLHLIEEHLRGSLLQAVASVYPLIDGEYALAVTDGRDTVLLRDHAGSKPLYISRRGFASEKKALWSTGEHGRSLSPSEIHSLCRGSLRLSRLCSTREIKNPLQQLLHTLSGAVEKRAAHVKKFGVLVSGMDSLIIAHLCARLGYQPRLYTLSLPGSADWSLRVEHLGLEHIRVEAQPEDVHHAIEPVLYATEDPSPLSLSIAIPIHLACRAAAAEGEKVLLTGQGCDELFGGYARYLSAPDPGGAMLQDYLHMHRTNLERDDKAAMSAGIELLHPYTDRRVAELALSLPARLKLKHGVRKHLIRRLAQRLGIPEAQQRKRAIQYSSGTMKVLKKLARSEKKTLSELVASRYSAIFSVPPA
ncbi:MAG: hypothetical protein GXN98_02050 [Euryarchaeota archaeon]|nr:hypothetical protein [Euryarchaeota archaeon]